MTDEYESINDVESTVATSTGGGARTAEQILKASDGKDSTVLDSTVETSTNAPRTAEQIMAEMKKEDKAKNAAKKASITSSIKSGVNKLKHAGDSAKDAVEKAEDVADTVEDATETITDNPITDVAETVLGTDTDSPTDSSSTLSTLAAGAVALGAAMDGDEEKNEQEDAVSEVSKTMSTAAPTDSAIALYQQDVAQAQMNGARVKSLPYTNEQQMQWNAQDQYRMYSNHGNMYEHGENEMEYNFAMLNSSMAMFSPPTKTLSPVQPFRQKVLSAIRQTDDEMDANDVSFDDILKGRVNILDTQQKESTEDMSVINNYEQNDIANSFEEAASKDTTDFTDKIANRLAMLNSDGMMDRINAESEKQNDFEADYF